MPDMRHAVCHRRDFVRCEFQALRSPRLRAVSPLCLLGGQSPSTRLLTAVESQKERVQVHASEADVQANAPFSRAWQESRLASIVGFRRRRCLKKSSLI